MNKSELHSALAVHIDVQGLRSFLAEAKAKNLNGVNDDPVMFELCSNLAFFMYGISSDDNAIFSHDDIDHEQDCIYCVQSSISDFHPAFFTMCDLLGYGLFTGLSNSKAYDLAKTYSAIYGDSICEDAIYESCMHVIDYAIPAGFLGSYTYKDMEDDLKETRYSVTPHSDNDLIFNNYKRLSLDALFAFNRVVSQFIKVLSTDQYVKLIRFDF